MSKVQSQKIKTELVMVFSPSIISALKRRKHEDSEFKISQTIWQSVSKAQ